jgi:DNA-binding transcriptional LysR family regulator
VAHVEALGADRLDVGFAIGADAAAYPDAVVAECVGHEPLAWALLPAGHPLATAGGGPDAPLPLAALVAALPMVLSERAAIPALHDRITAALARAGHVPRVVSAPPAWAAIVQLVAAGAGWCAVVAAGAEPAPPGTVARPVPELAGERDEVALELHVVRRRDAPAAADYVACVREEAALSRRRRAEDERRHVAQPVLALLEHALRRCARGSRARPARAPWW